MISVMAQPANYPKVRDTGISILFDKTSPSGKNVEYEAFMVGFEVIANLILVLSLCTG